VCRVRLDDELAQPLLADRALSNSQRYGGSPSQPSWTWLKARVPVDEFALPGRVCMLVGTLDGNPSPVARSADSTPNHRD